MKSFVRRLAMLSLISSALLSPVLMFTGRAEALTQEEVASKLSTVPVFVIVDAEGRSLMASTSNGQQEVQAPLVFIDGQDAENFLQNARQQNAEFASAARIAPVWLGNLYQQAQSQEGAPTPLAYIPDQQELEAATAIQANFQGVPLFIAKDSSDGAYLTIRENDQPTLPVFFSAEDLQTLIDRYKEQDPQAAQSVTVEVVSLESLIETMQNSDDPGLNSIRLFPASDVVEYLQDTATQENPQ